MIASLRNWRLEKRLEPSFPRNVVDLWVDWIADVLFAYLYYTPDSSHRLSYIGGLRRFEQKTLGFFAWEVWIVRLVGRAFTTH